MFCSTPTLTPERLVDRAHPFGVAAGQVVVDGHDVHALAARRGVGLLGVGRVHRQRVQHDREGRRQRLALAGLHLGDLARRAAPCRRSAGRRSGASPSCACRSRARSRSTRAAASSSDSPSARALAQLVHPLAQLGVGVVFELGLEGADQRHALLVGLELLRLADVQRAIEQGGHAPRIAPAAAAVGEAARYRPPGAAAGAPRDLRGSAWRLRRTAASPRRPRRGRARRGLAAWASRRWRSLSRWRLTWRASSSTIRFSEWMHLRRGVAGRAA